MIHSNISNIIQKYKKLHSDLIPRIMEAEAGIMSDLVDKGFKQQKSPYGESWPKNNDGSKFDKNGVIRASFESSYTSNSATIESSFQPAIFQQYGTKNIPAKQMIPESSEGLGNWGPPMLKAAKQVVKDIMNNSYTTYAIKKAASAASQAAKKIARKEVIKTRAEERKYNNRVKKKESKE